jgi:hypothetical protein
LFSSSLALRARLLSAIVSAKRPGFCVYKAKIVIPIPKVTPSKNASRVVDFISLHPFHPYRLLLGVYRFYENWSTESFTGKGFEKSPENQG